MNRRIVSCLLVSALCAAAVIAQAPPAASPKPQASKGAAPSPKKENPPPPGPPRPFEFPKHATKKLPNGLTVFVIEDHRLPLVSYTLDILSGGIHHDPKLAGLAGFTAGLLREGTKTRTSQDISKQVDLVGGNLGASAGDDTTTVTAVFTKSHQDLALELLADIVLNPVFKQEEIDRQMRQAQSGLAVQYNDAEYIAPLTAGRAILGMSSYAFPTSGTPESLTRIKRDDIVSFHARHYAPGISFLAIAGDITPEEAFAKAEKYLGLWKTPNPPETKLVPPPAPARKVWLVDMPNAVQTQIVLGHVGVQRNHPDFRPLQVANQVFGGSFNSRLNAKLRANEGLTYGANSGIESYRFTGSITASTFTRTEKTADAVRMMLDLFKEFRANPATDTEFQEAKAYIIGSHGRNIETPAAVAGRVLTSAVYGLPDDYWTRYREYFQALTKEQVAAAVQRHIQPDKLVIVAVGNTKEFAKAMAEFGPVEMLNAADIDFLAPDLRKVKEATKLGADAPARGKALLDEAVKAHGGLAALEAVKDTSSSSDMKMTLPQGQMNAKSTEEVLYPSGYRLVLKLPVGEVVQATDGTTAWVSQGPMSKELPPAVGKELTLALRTAAALELLRSAAKGQAEVAALDPVEAGGKKLDTFLWKRDGDEIKLSLDPQTRLVTRLAYTSQGREVVVLFSDYRDSGGVKLPFKELIAQGGQQVGERTYTERKVNAGLDPARFKKP